jgi:hypothetical protein
MNVLIKVVLENFALSNFAQSTYSSLSGTIEAKAANTEFPTKTRVTKND